MGRESILLTHLKCLCFFYTNNITALRPCLCPRSVKTGRRETRFHFPDNSLITTSATNEFENPVFMPVSSDNTLFKLDFGNYILCLSNYILLYFVLLFLIFYAFFIVLALFASILQSLLLRITPQIFLYVLPAPIL